MSISVDYVDIRIRIRIRYPGFIFSNLPIIVYFVDFFVDSVNFCLEEILTNSKKSGDKIELFSVEFNFDMSIFMDLVFEVTLQNGQIVHLLLQSRTDSIERLQLMRGKKELFGGNHKFLLLDCILLQFSKIHDAGAVIELLKIINKGKELMTNLSDDLKNDAKVVWNS